MSTYNQQDQTLYGDQYNAGGDIYLNQSGLKPGEIPRLLPDKADFFVNREAELAKLLAELEPTCRITLTGMGGMGKSALVAEAVHQLPPERFPDGIITHRFYRQPQVAQAMENIARLYGLDPPAKPRLGRPTRFGR